MRWVLRFGPGTWMSAEQPCRSALQKRPFMTCRVVTSGLRPPLPISSSMCSPDSLLEDSSSSARASTVRRQRTGSSGPSVGACRFSRGGVEGRQPNAGECPHERERHTHRGGSMARPPWGIPCDEVAKTKQNLIVSSLGRKESRFHKVGRVSPMISASDRSGQRDLRGPGGYKCSCKLWVEHLY